METAMGKAILILDLLRTPDLLEFQWEYPHKLYELYRISSFFSLWSRATARSVGGGGLTASESHFDLILFFYSSCMYPVIFKFLFFFPE
jgi:hypothetical protein